MLSAATLRKLRRASVIVAALVVWELAQRLGFFSTFNWESLLPPPLEILTTFWTLCLTGELFLHAGASLARVLIGLAFGVVAGIVLGALIAWVRLIEDLLDPIVRMARHVPPLAWIPLSILWFGIRDESAVFVIFIGAFFPMLLSTFSGVRNVDRGLLEAASTLGVTSTAAVIRRVLIPAAIPFLISGLRISLGMAWMTVVAAEMVAITSGLGFLIMDGRQLFRMDKVIVGMIVIGVIGYAIDSTFVWLERRLLPWRLERSEITVSV